jgi:hypothetical protein
MDPDPNPEGPKTLDPVDPDPVDPDPDSDPDLEHCLKLDKIVRVKCLAYTKTQLPLQTLY